jgi:hypothetical protein
MTYSNWCVESIFLVKCTLIRKGLKGKFRTTKDLEEPEERYSYGSILSLTSVLGEVVWPMTRPGRFILGTRTGTGGWVGFRACLDGRENISLPPGFELRTVQPVASFCTECAIPDHVVTGKLWENTSPQTVGWYFEYNKYSLNLFVTHINCYWYNSLY